MSPIVTIRAATVDDAPALATILTELGWFAALEQQGTSATIEQVRRHLQRCRADDSHSLFVAQQNSGEIAGYVAVHWLPYLFLSGPEGYVSELFVAADRRGRGIGHALLDTAVAEARRRGCARLALINSRHRESYQRTFYAKQGWLEREEVAHFIHPLSD